MLTSRDSNVNSWHTVAVRWRPWLLLPTGGLPTLGLECRFTVAREGLGVANATVV